MTFTINNSKLSLPDFMSGKEVIQYRDTKSPEFAEHPIGTASLQSVDKANKKISDIYMEVPNFILLEKEI